MNRELFEDIAQNVNDNSFNEMTKGSELVPSPVERDGLSRNEDDHRPSTICEDLKLSQAHLQKMELVSEFQTRGASGLQSRQEPLKSESSPSGSSLNSDKTENPLNLLKAKMLNGQEAFAGSQEELLLLSSVVELLSGRGLPPSALFPQGGHNNNLRDSAAGKDGNAGSIDDVSQALYNKRSRALAYPSDGDTNSVEMKRKDTKSDRFFWDKELHNKFLEAIFRLGANQDRPMELYMLVVQISEPHHSSFTEEDLNVQCVELRANIGKALEAMTEQLKIAYRYAPICTNINEKKGGNPTFHVYPFPYGDFKITENIIGITSGDYTRQFMAAVFDLGLQYARPKSIYKLMQPTPTKMTTGSIKSHLQKYRTNCKTTREMFIHQFRKDTPETRKEKPGKVNLAATSLIDHFNSYVSKTSQRMMETNYKHQSVLGEANLNNHSGETMLPEDHPDRSAENVSRHKPYMA